MRGSDVMRHVRQTSGGLEPATKRDRDVWASRLARDLAQDVRYAGRSLRRAPRVHDRRRRDDLPPQSATGIV
jgi:hypothetical protein